MNTTEQFYQDCGNIILLSTSMEHTLGVHLTMFLKNRRLLQSPENVNEFTHKTFNEKIKLLQRLCEEKKTNIERKERLLKALREMKNIRNQVGHWGMFYIPETGGYKLQNIKSEKEEPLDAGNAVKQMNDNYSIAYRELLELYNQLFYPETSRDENT